MQFQELSADEQDRLIELYYDRFAGRLDVYAIRVEFGDQVAYLPSVYTGDKEFVQDKIARIVREIGTPEFSREAIRAHLAGRYFLGAYPIQTDSRVRWFAIDFDKKKDEDPDPWQAALQQAKRLVNEAGLTVYIERSQGGKGFHVWGLLDSPVDAGVVRHALAPFIDRVETYDRMFPNQNGLSELKPLGNLIALPLQGQRVAQGNSAFVRRGPNGEPVAVEDQFAFLEHMVFNPASRIQELFTEAGEYVPEKAAKPYEGHIESLYDGWKVAHPIFGCEWVRWCYDNPYDVTEEQWYALACNFSQLEDGRELFHWVSAQDDLRYDAYHTDKKYDQALRQNKPHTCETIRGLGGNCECDRRFPGKVYHPFDLAKLPFKSLVESITDVGDGEVHISTADEGFDEVVDRLLEIEKDPEAGQGMPYGIPSLDKVTRLRESDLIIAAARPGKGKTAFAGSVMDYGARNGRPQYFFSAEMSKRQFWQRQLACRAQVSATRMATGQLTASDWEKIREAQAFVRNKGAYPVYVDDMSRSTERIFEMAARLVHRHGKGLIVVDYLQLLQRLPRESMFDAVTRIVHDLKLLAKALDCPVLVLTQLNRTADDATEDSETYDSWLRGCLVGSTKIWRADTNEAVPIGVLATSGEKHIPVWSVDEQGKLTVATMTHAFSNGVRDVYRLTTTSGRIITATDNHPFFTFNGWKPLGELAPGSRIAIPRVLPESQHVAQACSSRTVLLAHLIGDGSFAGPRKGTSYATASPENAEIVQHAAEAVFDVTVKGGWDERARTYQLKLAANRRLARGKTNPVADWLREQGMFGLRSPEKFVPNWVFDSGKANIALFLRHLWATDGCLRVCQPAKGRQKVGIYYATTSRQLADDVARLLLTFGIVARIHRSKKAGYRDGYQVWVTGREQQRTFLEEVGVVGPRKEHFEKALSLVKDGISNTNVDTLPPEVWSEVRSAAKAKGMSLPSLVRAIGRKWGGAFTRRCPSRSLVARLAATVGSDSLVCKATSDLFWDEVADITYVGKEEVFDATVPGTENFIADGIVVHNSGDIEQAADVIIFFLGENGPAVVRRILAIHKERHRESHIHVPVEFNQPLMTYAEEGTWSTSRRPSTARGDAPTVGDDIPSDVIRDIYTEYPLGSSPDEHDPLAGL